MEATREIGAKQGRGRRDPIRVLLVAADEHIGPALHDELATLAPGRPMDLRIMAPALAPSALGQKTGATEDSARDAATERLVRSLSEAEHELAWSGQGAVGMPDVELHTSVGDSDPILAIEDALREYPADEVVLVTHDHDHAAWLEDDMFERAQARIEPPIRHYVDEGGRVRLAESAPGHPGGVADTEPARYSPRDIAGIVFAIAGSLALFVIAGANPQDPGTGLSTGAVLLLIAGFFTLINIAHVVALLFFEAIPYRGPVQQALAALSLYGTAAAIVISLLLTTL